MKANEFIKRQGLEEARRVLHDARGCVGVKLWGRYEFSTEDLKRLVESHELVESCGGLQSVGEKLTHGMYESRAVIERLKQSIVDVESCQ